MWKPYYFMLLAFAIHEARAMCFITKNLTVRKAEVGRPPNVYNASLCESFCAEKLECYAYVCPLHTGCVLLKDENKGSEGECAGMYPAHVKQMAVADCPQVDKTTSEASGTTTPQGTTTAPRPVGTLSSVAPVPATVRLYTGPSLAEQNLVPAAWAKAETFRFNVALRCTVTLVFPDNTRRDFVYKQGGTDLTGLNGVRDAFAVCS